MPQRKSPENREGKGGSKATKSSARLSAKPAPPKPEPKPRKPSAHKEPGTKTNKSTKRKEGEHKAGKKVLHHLKMVKLKQKVHRKQPVDHKVE
ncbi:high mobility group nucleosome-binding domain-containing protein 3-like [Mirounga leonina]|uniref:high mobility group nucleosome-binding domain-containing protein 3-like n=1 Tax=Mirounga leonina TaxID=9715 RepID=UPI00156C3747|nr:high mobility group nucleosome-binding domain-containing protein 3-like [Mirounga leonina]